MKGILKTLVLTAIPICLIGLAGCGQNLQTSLGDVDSISKTNESVVIAESDPVTPVAEPVVPPDENRTLMTASGHIHCSITHVNTDECWEAFVDAIRSDPTEALTSGTEGWLVHWNPDEELCAGLTEEILSGVKNGCRCAEAVVNAIEYKCSH